MSIYTDPPEWEEHGRKPPSSKRTEGWKPGDRVPASWLNWFWFSTVNSLREIAQAFVSHVADKNNPHSVTKAQVGLGNVENYGISTQAEAEAGSVNNKYMTPLRVKQAVDASGTSAATANTLVRRDSAGRAKVAPPQAGDDIARKDTVDAHANATSVHGATSSATANRLVVRDANGRASVADPTSASHIATKGYVDSLVGSLQAGTEFAYYLTVPNRPLSTSGWVYANWWVWDEERSVVVRILLPGTIRYHVQYRVGRGICYVRILKNGSQIREVSTPFSSWQTVTGNITVSPGDIITIQKRTDSEQGNAYWQNVRIETAQPTLGIQRF